MAEPGPVDRGRYDALDGLRGVAALFVMLSHCVLMLRIDGPAGEAIYAAARLASKQAVILFFVLSGFVLFLSLEKRRPDYGQYAVRRITRIYLPFAAAIFLAALLYALTPREPLATLSDFFNYSSWQYPLSWKLLLGHLAMTDRLDLRSLDNVMWSLVHELRISLIFPLLAWATMRDWRWAFGVSVLISGAALHWLDTVPITALINPFATLRYLALFAAGAALAVNRSAVQGWSARHQYLLATAAWLALPLCALGLSPALENPVTAAFAILVVTLAQTHAPTRNAFSRRLPLWLGRVSYSLYLIHLPILLATLHLLAGRIPVAVALPVGILLCFMSAAILHRRIELPAIQLGRSLAGRLPRKAMA